MPLARHALRGSTSPPYLKDRLRDTLDGIKVSDTFAGGYDVEEIQDLRIAIKDVGNINLPLSHEQARQIISETCPIPLVRIDQVMNDTVTRNAWELDLRSLTITGGPRWDGLLKDVLKTVSEKLGITSPIQMHLYRALLFGKGVVCREHAAVEHTPHAFGTLVISLPSSHGRGDVAIRGHNAKKRLRSSQNAVTYTFWSANVTYKVLPVESGYRWVLVCNLATTIPLQRPLNGGPRMENELLREIMESWARGKEADNTKPLYYALDYHYAGDGLSLAGFLSRDRACVEQLLSAGRDLGFDIFLAILQRKDISDTAEHDWLRDEYRYDPPDSTLCAQAVFELNGGAIVSSLIINENDILQDDPFGDDPDKKQGPTWNESQVTRWYRTPALVIVPPKGILPFFTSYGSPLFNSRSKDPWLWFLNYCIDRYQSAYSEPTLELLLHILEKMSAARQLHWHTSTALSEKLYQLAITANTSKLIDWMIIQVIPLPLTVLSWLRRQFEMSVISFERLSAGISCVFDTRHTLSDQYQAILAIHEDIDPDDELLELLRSTAAKAICNWVPICSYEDGLALFDLTVYSHDNLEVMKSSIIPKLVKSSHLTAFMFGFIHKWRQSMRRKQVPLNEAKPIYEELVRATVQKMSMSLVAAAVVYTTQGCENQTLGRPIIPVVSHPILHGFTVSLFEPGLEEQRDLFMKKISFDAMSIEHNSFKTLWIPLLQDLLFACEKFKISLAARTWQQLYQAVLKSFLLRCVGKPPKPDLVKPRLSCPCKTCRKLNQFLVDPTQKVTRLNMPKSEINHITTKLSVYGIDCTYRREPQGGRCIVITKTDRKGDAQRSVYEEQKLEAAKHLSAFDRQKLRTVLAGEYEAIMTMSLLEASEGTAATSSLAPIPANSAGEIARLGIKMKRPVNTTPSGAPIPAMGNNTVYDPPKNWATPSQTISRNRAEIPTRTSTLPHTTVSGASRANLPATRPTISSFLAARRRISSTPIPSTRQRGPAPRAPVAPVTTFDSVASPRSVSWPSRRPPSTMIPHPVAGAKRKRVELIDLTLHDD